MLMTHVLKQCGDDLSRENILHQAARGLHIFIPQQFRREWKRSPAESGDVVHLPEATALIVGVGGIGSEAARLLSAFGVTVLGTDARRTTAPALPPRW
jgi:phosphoglycerate dehydrogenase-like enzyme